MHQQARAILFLRRSIADNGTEVALERYTVVRGARTSQKMPPTTMHYHITTFYTVMHWKKNISRKVFQWKQYLTTDKKKEFLIL